MKSKRKINNITILLNKYWDGSTSVQEERIIKSFFRENDRDMPRHEFEWFKLLSEYQLEPISVDLGIFERPKVKNKIKVINSVVFIKYAAIIVLVISFWFGYSYNKKRNEEENVVVLRQKVETDLLFISQSLNDGMENLESAQDGIFDNH